MIEIAVVTKLPDGAADAGEILVETVAAEEILGLELERHIARRHLHDEIERATGLRAELQGRTGADEFDPLDRVEDRRVMRFRKTELLVLDRDAVLQDLHELAPLRVEPAVAEIDDRRGGLLAHEQARRGRERFPVIVIRDAREFLRFHKRGFLAGVDPRSLHFGQRRVFHRVDLGAFDNQLRGLDRRTDERMGEVRVRFRQLGAIRGDASGRAAARVTMTLPAIPLLPRRRWLHPLSPSQRSPPIGRIPVE